MAWAQTVAHSALFGTVLEYPTTGCEGAVVVTPLPGKQFIGPQLNMSDSVTSFYEEAAKLNVTWASEMTCTPTNHTHAFVPAPAGPPTSIQSQGIKNAFSSGNWSGFQNNSTAQYVQAGWTIPATVRPRPSYSTSYYSSTWTGIGGGMFNGIAAPPLIQAGSSQDFNVTPPAYYFWYEFVPVSGQGSGEVRVSNPAPPTPGDVAGSVTIWLPPPPNSPPGTLGSAEFGICDFTTVGCIDFILPNVPAPGTTVEWIVEAPTINGLPSYLADYGSVSFEGACWATSSVAGTQCQPISAGVSPTGIFLQQYVFNRLQTLSTPGPLNSDGAGFTPEYIQPER